MRQVYSRLLIQIELISHFLNAFEPHFQTQVIEIAIARFHDRDMHVGRAMIAAHAAREFVADRDAASAHQIGVSDGYGSLLQSGSCHERLPGRAWRIPSLNGPID